MFAKKRDYTVELKSCLDHLATIERGGFVKHTDLEQLSKFGKSTHEYRTLMVKLKRSVLDQRGIELVAIHGVGYRLLTVEAQMKDRLLSTDKKIARIRRRQIKSIGVINRSELSDEQFALQSAAVGLLTSQERTQREDRATLTSWLSTPATLPKPVRRSLG